VRTDELDYELPPELIAQEPAEPRDSARLMVVHRASGAIEHRRFRDLPAYLGPGDVLVANDSRVLPARLRARKAATGGMVELLLLREHDAATWEALVRGRVAPGTRLTLAEGTGQPTAEVVALLPHGSRLVRFDCDVRAVLARLGELPLPPYIRTMPADPERYQTVYAREPGSAAAPTAGLHFTAPLLEAVASVGAGLAFVTLHVGLDTFRPIEEDEVEAHAIHREWAELPEATAEAVNAARRVVAVGTTAVRVLETAAAEAVGGRVAPYRGWTGLYIRPGHEFRAVDALVTNFHLPRSTLLLLVAAFTGRELMERAYREAIAERYRFYSFGDAMLLL
jgi:S-adenosylmethionine:tRNA ribosyltransferase-isomerase